MPLRGPDHLAGEGARLTAIFLSMPRSGAAYIFEAGPGRGGIGGSGMLPRQLWGWRDWVEMAEMACLHITAFVLWRRDLPVGRGAQACVDDIVPGPGFDVDGDDGFDWYTLPTQ